MRPLLVALVVLLLPGCTLFVPKFEQPKLTVANVELLKSDLWHQELKVRMRVQNPNQRTLPIKGITYVLELDDQEFAHGESAASFVVPAMGEAEFDMSVSANMASIVIKVLAQGGRQVDYHIKGRIALSQGVLRSIAFEDEGKFRFQ